MALSEEQTTTSTTADLGTYPWIAMAVVLVGSYMVILDTTVLGVALPDIADDFRSSSSIGIDWVVTAYLVAMGTVHVAAGWLADRFGKRRAYLFALVAFAFGSLISGLAPTLELMIGARIVQGIGGGVLMPVGMAIVYELFPPDKRGTALGIWGIAVMAAPALGPPLGGWLVSSVSWRWIFLLNVPIGVLALSMAWRLLRDIGYREHRAFDGTGLVLAGVGVSTVVIASRSAADWGVLSARTVLVFGAGLLVLAGLIRRSLARPDPIIDFRMFAVPTFSISAGVVALVGISQFARLTFLPVELQVVRHLGADQVGLMLTPAALGVATTMWLGGWLADRIGARTPVIIGLVIASGAVSVLARLSPTTPIRTIVVALFVSGVGTGLAMMPNVVAAMNSLPARFVSQASALRALNRQLSRAVGTAVLAAVIVSQLGTIAPRTTDPAVIARAQDSYNEVFAISVVALVLAVALAFFLPDRERMRHYQRERAQEHAEIVVD